MKALLLAAGRGTRVRPITDTLPKPMIPIINKPVMAFLVEHLKKYDIDQIMVNTSYMSSQIEQYFRDGERFGVKMAYSFEGKLENGNLIDNPLGSAGAIQKIHQHSKFFDETFVVLCGDAVIDIDFEELIRFHREKGALATIALREVPIEEVHNYGVVVQDQNGSGRITEFQEKPAREKAKSRMINTGIYIFEPEVLTRIPKTGAYDIGSQLFPALAQEGVLYGVTSSKPWQWLDIGRVPDFHEVTMKALRGEIHGFKMPGTEVRPGVWLGMNVKIDLDRCKIEGPVFIGGSSEIENDVSIVGPVSVGAGALIESGVHLENTVICDYTRVKNGTYCNSKIIGGDFCADADGTILNNQHTDTEWLFGDSRIDKLPLNNDQIDILNRIQYMSVTKKDF